MKKKQHEMLVDNYEFKQQVGYEHCRTHVKFGQRGSRLSLTKITRVD